MEGQTDSSRHRGNTQKDTGGNPEKDRHGRVEKNPKEDRRRKGGD